MTSREINGEGADGIVGERPFVVFRNPDDHRRQRTGARRAPPRSEQRVRTLRYLGLAIGGPFPLQTEIWVMHGDRTLEVAAIDIDVETAGRLASY